MSLFLSFLQGCKSGFRTRVIILILFLILARATLRVRIANQVGEDSCCRGGIVDTGGGRSRALFLERPRPRRFGGFVQVLQTVQVAVHGRQLTRTFVIFIKLTLNKIFEYMKMTTLSRPCGSSPIRRRFDFFV